MSFFTLLRVVRKVKTIDEFIPLNQWSILQCRLHWAYERPFENYRKWVYVPAPDAAWLIQKGTVTLHYESGSEYYEAGSWVFPRNAEATQEFAGGVRILSLRFQAEWSFGVPLFARRHSLAVEASHAPELTRDARALVRCVDRLFPWNKTEYLPLAGSLDNYLQIQPLFLKCVSSYYFTLLQNNVSPHIPGEIDDNSREALQYLEAHPLDLPLVQRDVAQRVGLSVSQLNRIFSRDLRISPAAVWNKRKLASACSQLIQNTASIKQIAYSVGFSSPEHFSTWFRRNTNLSPRKYRQQYQLGGQLL